MKEDLEQLAAEIHAEFPGATTEIESHPPSLMLNVRWNSKLFVLAYVGNRWGVDMMRDGEGFDTGLRLLAQDFAAGKADLLRLMRAP